MLFTRFDESRGWIPPMKAHEDDAGFDLYASTVGSLDILLWPFQRTLVPTNTRALLPVGYEAQIRPRSGVAYKRGLTVLNSPATIDAGYRGEIFVLLINLSLLPRRISHFDRIAQLVLAPVVDASALAAGPEDTARAAGGFGSTGR